jgi:plastocyanin
MNRHLAGFVALSALTAFGCADNPPRRRDASTSTTDETGGTGGGVTGGAGGIGSGGADGSISGGAGGARTDAAPDVRPEAGMPDAPPADVVALADLAHDMPAVPIDAAPDVVVHVDAAIDAAVDMAPPSHDVAPDLSPDTAPDLAHDVAPDLSPDVAPDLAHDVAPDAMAFMALPGCASAGGYTVTQDLHATVNFGGAVGTSYSPRCLRLARTAQVTFSGSFSNHPLSPTTGMGSAPNPITHTGSGTSATFTFNAAGFYPYHCDFHDVSDNMHGVIWVAE